MRDGGVGSGACGKGGGEGGGGDWVENGFCQFIGELTWSDTDFSKDMVASV